ncbi:MAG: hypothetical protein H7833_20950 [Magnetococcus sp. DMHC-1]
MPTVAQVLRNTSVPALKNYFGKRFGQGSTIVDWQGSEGTVVRRLMKAVTQLSLEGQATLSTDFDRMFDMTDEAGECAIASLFPDRNEWPTGNNAYDRIMWLYLNDPERFRRAEEIRYAEHQRQGRRWSGYVLLSLHFFVSRVDFFQAANFVKDSVFAFLAVIRAVTMVRPLSVRW